MKSLTSIQNLLVKIFTLLLVFNITVLANNFYTEVSDEPVAENSSVALEETVEVSLDSFSNVGIFIMIALSSLLGAFFVKDEFSGMLEEKF
jgi:hypothetical protein